MHPKYYADIMSKNIKLSKSHGLNPSVEMCFFCGEAKSLMLFGKLDKEDSEAPREIFTNYDPCDKCEETFNTGFLVVEVSQNPVQEDQPALNGVYPTGRYALLSSQGEDRLREVFTAIPEDTNKILLDSEAFSAIGLGQ